MDLCRHHTYDLAGSINTHMEAERGTQSEYVPRMLLETLTRNVVGQFASGAEHLTAWAVLIAIGFD